MNKYELYKLKVAGLSNLQVFNIVNYWEMNGEWPSLELIAKIAGCRNQTLFMERYIRIDDKVLMEEFKEFDSISIMDSEYPEELLWMHNPPVLLFYSGNIDLLKHPKIAVVGSRSCSRTGIQSVEKIINELNNELIVVSGLAKGIDAAAHYAAIRNGGKTIGVIGTGLDVFYPRSNKQLQKYMGGSHLVLTEYGPGQGPQKHHFPERNRIIAGLSRAVIVAEARMRSGSLITCERAMEEGRDVFAIPGSILDGRSDGCHHLIQEGAKLVTIGRDVLDEFEF
ncbi:DNA-processing protein DprA [Streptococcus australis]|uniref:DNA-processing protein DprA n=1 Tax=Streptococcus australis TaxID=113107 RepID=UPI0018976284|nr:DNA-processing protein DprA [Streptococcus australis]MDB8650330.1 DNA-processing protein DprA [Streptococcus australis]